MRLVTVTQGESRISADPGLHLAALLGSCVACCLWDEEAALGGMLHLLVPPRGAEARDGAAPLARLVAELVARGAREDLLRAKLFGGARMLGAGSEVGPANAVYALSFLAEAGIPCLAQSLGGSRARLVRFHPVSGAARQRLGRREGVLEVAPGALRG